MYTPVHCVSQNPIFLQNVKCVGATVIEFRFFNWITKKKKKKTKKKKKKKNIVIMYIYEYLTHTASNYIEIFVGVNFCGDLHLDVELN